MSDGSLDFRVSVLALDQGCVCSRPPVEGEEFSPCEGDLHAHHAVTQQQLRKAGLDSHLWDPANGAAVCKRHHRRHHNRREPIRIDALPVRVRSFADDHQLWHLLERYYAA